MAHDRKYWMTKIMTDTAQRDGQNGEKVVVISNGLRAAATRR